MLDEIRAGNVATVIIKDQRRIGRDVVEAGLLKRTFDEYHVRFIAANDPETVERYENYLASRREAYHRKKQESEKTA